jgi:hypothetical protein
MEQVIWMSSDIRQQLIEDLIEQREMYMDSMMDYLAYWNSIGLELMN